MKNCVTKRDSSYQNFGYLLLDYVEGNSSNLKNMADKNATIAVRNCILKKVKQSRYRPGVAQRVAGS
jgi:hypothetical protein